IIPHWWGIINVNKGNNGSIYLEMIRKPQLNSLIDNSRLAQMLWKNEQITLLEKYGYKKGVKSKTRKELSNIIGKYINEKDIKNFVREPLRIEKIGKLIRYNRYVMVYCNSHPLKMIPMTNLNFWVIYFMSLCAFENFLISI